MIPINESQTPEEVPEGYVPVTFHVLEEDLVRGLTVTLLEVPGEGLVPFTWISEDSLNHHTDYRSSTIARRRDESDIVDLTQFGGTLEQLRHKQKQHARLMERRGRKQGDVSHRPRDLRPKANETLAERLKRLRPYIESPRYALTEDDVRHDFMTARDRYASGPNPQ